MPFTLIKPAVVALLLGLSFGAPAVAHDGETHGLTVRTPSALALHDGMREAEKHMMMADALTDGLIAAFPDKFQN